MGFSERHQMLSDFIEGRRRELSAECIADDVTSRTSRAFSGLLEGLRELFVETNCEGNTHEYNVEQDLTICTSET